MSSSRRLPPWPHGGRNRHDRRTAAARPGRPVPFRIGPGRILTGLALTIIIKQLRELLGIEASDGGSFRRLRDLVLNLDESQGRTMIVGFGSHLLMILIEQRLKRFPAALVLLVAGIVLVAFAESIGPARLFARSHGYRINADQELVALGGANIAAGAFHGFSSLSSSAGSSHCCPKPPSERS